MQYVDSDRSRVEQFDLHGVTYNRGDQIKVLPSAPRHRDGFIGRVMHATLDGTGAVLYVDVFGAPGSKAPSMRTLLPVRLAAPPKRRIHNRHDHAG
jgi:hypothetical protein